MRFICIVLHVLASSIFLCKGETPINNNAKSETEVNLFLNKENVWVFVFAGQSNMAGRALIEHQDTIVNNRIFTINSKGNIIPAKEPVHFYEPKYKGLDCSISFGKHLLRFIPDSITLLLIPTAVGGSSINQWLGDSVHRGVKLLSNFREKIEIGKKHGQIKAILWHQGESNANKNDVLEYERYLSDLLIIFRKISGNSCLPVLLGELGSYAKNQHQWDLITKAIHSYSVNDVHTMVISALDFQHKGDRLHFDSESQRLMGKRFADVYLKISNKNCK